MTEKQAIEAIISEPKYYIGVMPQSTASNFIRRWKKGEAKNATTRKFLKKFGYVVATELTYKKCACNGCKCEIKN